MRVSGSCSQKSVFSVKSEAKSSAETGVGTKGQRQRIPEEEMRKLVYRENIATCRAGWKSHRGVTVLTKGRLPGSPVWKLSLQE